MPYIIKNGKTYTGNSVTLTQAQYDALSEAEKNNGVAYYIYDSDTVLDASDVSYGTGTVESTLDTKANEDVIASVEATPTATSSYSVGSYILLNSNHRLYRVTSAITAGQTISTSTNVERVTIGGELRKLHLTITINSGENLDDYYGSDKSGLYYCNGATDKISNLPFNYCALLIIAPGSASFQLAWNKSAMAFRGRTGSPASWGEWKNVSFT